MLWKTLYVCFVNKKFMRKKWMITKKEMHQNSEPACKDFKRKRKIEKNTYRRGFRHASIFLSLDAWN